MSKWKQISNEEDTVILQKVLNVRLELNAKLDIKAHRNGYDVSYTYDGEMNLDDKEMITEEKEKRIAEKIIKVLAEELK